MKTTNNNMKDHLYIPFDKFILRTPLFPFDWIYKTGYDSLLFEEALFIASPSLYKERIKTIGASDKINRSLYKYYSRAASRSTPFGLFATCSIGSTNSEQDNCIISAPEDVKRHTRLDMNFLCALIQDLESLPHIRKHLKYYTNDSIYQTGDKLRYVEYYFKGLKKIHQIQEVSKTNYLDKILDSAKYGKRIITLAQTIVDEDVSLNEALDFVQELISNQVLKSELEANLTGDDVLTHIIQILESINEDIPELQILIKISKALDKIDGNLFHDENQYTDLFGYIKSLKINFDEKYLIQTDTFRESHSCLSRTTINELNDLISYLLRFVSIDNDKRFEDFIRSYLDRYEEEEIPLLEALDTDIGIGYPAKTSSDCINPLLEDIVYPSYIRDQTTTLTPFEIILIQKFNRNPYNDSELTDEILLDDNDVITNNIETQKLPLTCNVMVQIINDGRSGDGRYVVKSVGGSTAASLLGRFCYLDDDILELTTNICKMEQKLLPEGIIAEIVHLPDTRIGNIAFRPVLRDLEIHYLARSGAGKSKSIPASDLVLGIKQGKLYIKSQTLNKIIIPRLSNAHNYSMHGLPVYRFLCDMQTYGLAGPRSLNINNILNIFHYVPRICYKKFILSPRTWIISESDVLINGEINSTYLNNKRVPERILIKDFDNELFIDMAMPSCRDIFKDILRKRKRIIIEEFLYNDKSSIITDGKSNYCGEFIVPFYKK